jgi:PiT family inorganic phosphate transporter
LSTGFIALVLTFLEVPISISQIMVGSVLGVGLALGILESMHYDVVAKIILSWIATPIASCVLTNLLYNLIVIPLSARLTFISFNRLCVILTIFGAMFMSYDIGANDIGVILGPLVASGLFKELNFAGLVVSPVFLLSAFIGVVAGVGALFLGEPVAYTIGKKITVLDPMSSFSSQLGAGMVIYFFILLGIPISTGQAIVGGIFGVGLAKGMNLIGRKTMRKIIVWWITTPLIALVLSALLYRIIIIF